MPTFFRLCLQIRLFAHKAGTESWQGKTSELRIMSVFVNGVVHTAKLRCMAS